MNRIDIPTFTARLDELADALGHKRVSEVGLKVWLQALNEFPLPDLVAQLDIWAKTNARFPTPASLWERCNNARTDRIEEAAKLEKVRERREADAVFKRSDKLGRALRSLVKTLKDREPTDPKEWAELIWQRYITDTPMPPREHPFPVEERVVQWQGETYTTRPDPTEGTPVSHVQVTFAAAALHRKVEQANRDRDEYRAAKRVAA